MRDLDVGSVYSRVLSIYGSQFVTLLGAALAVNLIVAAAATAVRGVGGALVVSVLSIVLATLYSGMVVRLVQDLQDGRRDASAGQLLRSVTPVLAPLIGAAIVSGLLIAIGFVLLIVPGLFLMTIFAVVAPVVVVEQPGVISSLSRSSELVRGNGMAVFGVIVIAFLLTFLVSQVATAIGTSTGDVGLFLLTWILPALVAPVTALVAAVVYFELRGEPVRWAPPTASAFDA